MESRIAFSITATHNSRGFLPPNSSHSSCIVARPIWFIIRGTMDDHATNLLRLLTAQVHALLLFNLSRDRFGKSFLELDDQENADVQAGIDAAVKLFAVRLDAQTV